MWDSCCSRSKLGVVVLLYRDEIGCGISGEKVENVFVCCCKWSKLVVGFLLKKTKCVLEVLTR